VGAADDYRNRDEPIRQLLLSSDEGERKKGMELMERTFVKPVASVLLSIARKRKSTTFDAFLDEEGSLNVEVFQEVWHQAMFCVWQKVQKNPLKLHGSILAYLVKIAGCRTVDRWRRQRRIKNNVNLGLCAGPPNERPNGLLEDIELFYDSLSEKEQVLLRLGVDLAIDNDSGRGIRAELIARFLRIAREKGWKDISEGAVVRRYSRLRVRLRQFLKERGYDV
jgi:hypothetical protein